MLALYERNAAFLAPWEPRRSQQFYTLAHQETTIQTALTAAGDDRAYMYGIVLNAANLIIGRLTLSNIVRGVFQNAYLGYWIDGAHGGRGLMTEAVALALGLAFGPHRLHRVQAAVMPSNIASRRVLEKNGFRREGLAERYLEIDGRWQDHLLYAITVEEWQARHAAETTE
jgi:ribosomal-protein-alanine N-acetyltransferase